MTSDDLCSMWLATVQQKKIPCFRMFHISSQILTVQKCSWYVNNKS